MKNKLEETIRYVKDLKRDYGIEVIDTHTHPMDVMGTVHPSEYFNLHEKRNDDVKKPKEGILELLQYGTLVSIISPLYYKFFPNSVHEIIRNVYKYYDKNRMLREMDVSCIDKSVLLPINPWVDFSAIKKNYNHNRFYHLCSVDVHGIKIENIRTYIKECKNNGAIGIKMHPNLQGFYPNPSDNKKDVCKKLKVIYSSAEEEKMYMLFHGGKSFYVDKVNKKYKDDFRDDKYGLIENYIDKNGNSEVFGKYKIPVIIAHLGHFGVLSFNKNIMKNIAKLYNNVYFDTSGCSPGLILSALGSISYKKMIFGTDTLYNRSIYGLYFLKKAVSKFYEEEKAKEVMVNILSHNFKNILKSIDK